MFNCSPVWKYLLSELGWAAPAGGGLFVLLSPTRQDGDIDIYTGPHQPGVFRLGKLGNMIISQLYLLDYPDIYGSTGCRYSSTRDLCICALLCLDTDGLLVSSAVMEMDGVLCMMEAGMVTGTSPLTAQHSHYHQYTSCDTTHQREEARTIRALTTWTLSV